MSSLHFDNVLQRLQSILENHFDQLGPQPNPQQLSLRYRTILYMFYQHMKFLCDHSASKDPSEYPCWHRAFCYNINLIHNSLGTIQRQSYDNWPQL
jgi:hypothetical protein